MAKRVAVQVNKDGTIRAEFSGFAGDDCVDQAERLRAVLAGLGLLIDPIAVQRKDPGQIALETAEDESTGSDRRQEVPRPR